MTFLWDKVFIHEESDTLFFNTNIIYYELTILKNKES